MRCAQRLDPKIQKNIIIIKVCRKRGRAINESRFTQRTYEVRSVNIFVSFYLFIFTLPLFILPLPNFNLTTSLSRKAHSCTHLLLSLITSIAITPKLVGFDSARSSVLFFASHSSFHSLQVCYSFVLVHMVFFSCS